MSKIACDAQNLVNGMKKLLPIEKSLDELYFICIGTDRSTGDSLGPMIGSQLTKLGYTNVMGTLDEPLHAMNLKERVDEIDKSKTVIAIDAALGKLTSVGNFQVCIGPLTPGAGVNRKLGEYGDFNVTGVVNVGGFMEFFVLQNTRLSLIFQMSNVISNAIQTCFPLNNKPLLEEINYEQFDIIRANTTTVINPVNAMVEAAEIESKKIQKPPRIIGD